MQNDKVEEIKKLRRQGKSYNEIVKILGMSKRTVYKHGKTVHVEKTPQKSKELSPKTARKGGFANGMQTYEQTMTEKYAELKKEAEDTDKENKELKDKVEEFESSLSRLRGVEGGLETAKRLISQKDDEIKKLKKKLKALSEELEERNNRLNRVIKTLESAGV